MECREATGFTETRKPELGYKSLNTVPPDDKNPMLNEVVLKILFNLCDVEDLLKFRLVSKKWYSSSLVRVRKESTVYLNEKSFVYPECHWHWSKLQDLPEIGEKAFQVYCLKRAITLVPTTTTGCYSPDFLRRKSSRRMTILKSLEQFWPTHGTLIRKLELIHDFYPVPHLKKVIFEDTPNLEELTLDNVRQNRERGGFQVVSVEMPYVQPKLKSLSISKCGSQGRKVTFPVAWSVLFAFFPNIQKLDLNVENDDVITPLVEKCQLLDEIPLREIQLGAISREHVTSLKGFFQLAKLKLHKLQLVVEDSEDVGRRVVQLALQQQGDNLQEIHVDIVASPERRAFEMDEDEMGPTQHFPFRHVALAFLTHLELTGPLCQDFLFLQKTPNLQVLRLRNCPGLRPLAEVDREIMEAFKLPFLKEFNFQSALISEESMRIFVSVMPKLERFYGFVDTPSFRVICQNWRNLNVLVVDYDLSMMIDPELDLVGDEALTGVVAGKEEILPNITALKYLRQIKIMNTGKIGEGSVWNGFLKLPLLRSLDVILLEMSIAAEAALCDRIIDGFKMTNA